MLNDDVLFDDDDESDSVDDLDWMKDSGEFHGEMNED